MSTLPIKFPPGFYPKVTKGDTVAIGQILAMKNKQTDEVVDLPAQLGIDVRDVPRTVKKNPGDSVVPGDILALKKELFGEKKVISGAAGTVLRFERDKGILIIRVHGGNRGTDTKETIVSPLDGAVILCNNEEIRIRSDSNGLVGKNGIGPGVEGELVKANGLSRSKSGDEDDVIAADLTADQIGKIIIGGVFNREVLSKASAMGILGVIASEILEEDLAFLTEKDLPLTAVVFSKEDVQKIAERVGKRVFLNGQGKTVLFLHYEKKP
ncbi:MAG: hypothetical protein HY431_02930 [Candidatus Levybacteria bacterium]|nr:hypothetical protein [Candidatus Levybacteria bacterium]